MHASGVPAPDHARLMKASLCREPFSDPEWTYERKLDGVRCLAICDDGRRPVRMLSRNDLDLTGRYPELRDALSAQSGARCAIDGEIVAFDGAQTSFARLAARAHRPVPVFLYAFDLLWLEGEDLTGRPLRERRRALRDALTWTDPLRLTAHRNATGEAMFAEACRRGWEGVVAKRADSAYRATRSRDWLKFKCEAGQELVVGGFTAPRGARAEFGALLLGIHERATDAGEAGSEPGPLRYAGKVGTGFDADSLRELGARMRALATPDPPFADASAIRERGVTWIRPELVAAVAFTEWTAAGRLRHPRFLGLREDKPADEVVRER